MKNSSILIASTLLLIFSSCIKDDFVNDTIDPELRIKSTIDTLAIDSFFQFEAMYLNNVGQPEVVPVTWSSSQPEKISINSDGLAHALELGSSYISISHDNGEMLLKDSLKVIVGMNTIVTPLERKGNIASTSSYTLTGSFSIKETNGELLLEFEDNYQASTSLPGLYLYLSNNRNTITNAHEVGAVQVFSGTHSYTIPDVRINDFSYLLYYCKPFNVKVGDGAIE